MRQDRNSAQCVFRHENESAERTLRVLRQDYCRYLVVTGTVSVPLDRSGSTTISIMKIYLIRALVMISALVLATFSAAPGPVDRDIRPPAVSGQFYPSDPARLKLAIQQFLKDAVQVRVEKPVALVVPHAGYIYAGQIYADAYRQVMGREYDVIVVLGTNHTSADLDGISVYKKGAFRTPLGDMPIDESVTSVLLAQDSKCTSNTEAHVREHSIEVQVPFLQVLFPKAKIVPLVIGSHDIGILTRFSQILAQSLAGRRALIVISSDLSHYPSYEDAIRTDRQILETVVKLDPKALSAQSQAVLSTKIRNLATCACGEAPLLAGILTAKALGATSGVVASYANSGDVALEDRSRVVGYGSVIFCAEAQPSPVAALTRPLVAPATLPLQYSDKKALLAFARESLTRFMTSDTVPLARGFSPRLSAPQGAFVTLRKHGELRGCIGHIPADYELAKTVGAMALQAALNDHRFDPVRLNELPDIEIEISVLTPMKRIARAEEIIVGRDGVVISKAGRSAVFLPQVALEQHWGRNELLENLCQKAGLPADAWNKDAQLFVFQAVVFKEAEFK